MSRPLISICIPVKNEAGNINPLYERLSSLALKMSDRCDMEFIFSDNNSADETWALIRSLALHDRRVRAIRFTKDFGFQRSILANFMHARGDAVMQVDADLQDPPELLEEFWSHWRKGVQVVYGVRLHRPESMLMRGFRRLGYWIIDKMGEHPIPQNVGDFRLIDRRVVNFLLTIRTPNPYIRGMIASAGFSHAGIDYNRVERRTGSSKFNIWRLGILGLTAIFNHSTVPLRMASVLGLGIMLLSIAGAVYYLLLKIAYPDLPRGLASIHILVLFGVGLNALFLGILGEYLLRIYLVLRSDPIAVIEESVNLLDAKVDL